MHQLTKTSEGLLAIRQRFIDVFERDILGKTEIDGSKAIIQEKAVAHRGDAMADAMLHDREHCTDKTIHRKLYGLDYSQVFDCGMRNYVLSTRLVKRQPNR